MKEICFMNCKQLITPLAWLGLSMLAFADSEDSKDSKNLVPVGTSPVQSPARPYDLNIVAPVQMAGSDDAAKAFQSEVLPGMLETIAKQLPELNGKPVKNLDAISLDPAKLVLNSDASARVYFLGENSAHKNTLGISTTGGGPLSPDAALIFPNLSSPTAQSDNQSLVRTTNQPLLAGDFVNLGAFKAGTALDFFLIASGATGGETFYSTNVSLNKDGIIHAVSLAPDGSAYLIIGFEETKGGGDKDYNEALFAVAINQAAVSSHIVSIGAPEPSLATGALLTTLALLGFSRRRRS